MNLSGAGVRDMAVLSPVRFATNLDVGANPELLDFSGSGQATAVETLKARNAGLQSLTGIGAMAKLRELDLSGCRSLVNIEAVSKLESLEVLDLSYNEQLRDISAIAKLGALRVLNLSNTAITSIEPLRRLPRLEKLIVSGTRVRSLDGLPPSVRELVLQQAP